MTERKFHALMTGSLVQIYGNFLNSVVGGGLRGMILSLCRWRVSRGEIPIEGG